MPSFLLFAIFGFGSTALAFLASGNPVARGLARIIGVVLLALFGAFCAFGFLAAGEVSSESSGYFFWKATYLALGAAAIWMAGRLIRRR